MHQCAFLSLGKLFLDWGTTWPTIIDSAHLKKYLCQSLRWATVIHRHNELPGQIPTGNVRDMPTSTQGGICRIRMYMKQDIPRTIWKRKFTDKEKCIDEVLWCKEAIIPWDRHMKSWPWSWPFAGKKRYEVPKRWSSRKHINWYHSLSTAYPVSNPEQY